MTTTGHRAAIIGALTIGLGLFAAAMADLGPEMVSTIAFEQRGSDTVCTQLPSGDWRCVDDVPVRLSWRSQ